MDNLWLNTTIHGMVPPSNALKRATVVWRSSFLSLQKPPSPSHHNNLSCPLVRSSVIIDGGNNRCSALREDEDVSGEENGDADEEDEGKGGHGNWVMKILHVRSLGKQGNDGGAKLEDQNVEEECEGCCILDDETTEFDQESFSRLLKKVSLAEARLYAQLSYLGSLAYDISQIKPKNRLRYYRLGFVTSSFEKKEQAVNAEREKASAEGEQPGKENVAVEAAELKESKLEQADEKDKKTEGEKLSRSASYEIAASAASYLHACTQSINPFRTSKSTHDEDLSDCDKLNISHENVASLMATTESVTSVVAAKEEVKQAVADDLNSISLSPCEWFICDDDQSAIRYFVIQGSESLASWKANLLFEPIRFEGLNVPVHRGIYEAAKGIYEQMLPEVHPHLKAHGSRARFRFTGHSLGGSLSLLVNLMLLIRGEVPISSLLPVITFGSPAVMCGGDQLLHQLGLPRNHVQSISMHRDIVPRAFSCNYPNHVAKILKAVNGNFRNHPCLNNQALLYAPMGEFLILQPSEKFSPHHHLLPPGSGLYWLRSSVPDSNEASVPDSSEADKAFRAALSVFLNSPHPLEILSDRSAYGSSGSINRDHDMNSYLKSIRNVIRQELTHIRKARKERRGRFWRPPVALHEANVRRPVLPGNMTRGRFSFSGVMQNGRESFKRFRRLVASQHMHLLVVLLFPTRLLILGACSIIKIY